MEILVLMLMAFLGGYAVYTVCDIIMDIRREKKLAKRGRRILKNMKAA